MATLRELQQTLTQRKFDLADVLRNNDLDEDSYEDPAPIREDIRVLEDAVAAVRSGRTPKLPSHLARPADEDAVPAVAATPVAGSTAGVQTKSSIPEMEAAIKKLEGDMIKAIRDRAPETIIDRLSRLIMTKKRALVEAQFAEEESSPEGKRAAEIRQIEAEIDRLTQERQQAVQSFDVKIDALSARLRGLAPRAAAAATSRVGAFEDDLDRLKSSMVDRRSDYRRAYGVDPSVGIDGNAMGLVRIRPAPSD